VEMNLMFPWNKATTVALLGFGLLTATTIAGEKKIPVDQLPKPVASAFKAKFPEVTIKNVIEESADGKITYEIESLNKAGMSLDAILKPDGEIVTVEKEIKPADLPAAVAPAVAAKFPKGTITKAEAVTSGKKTTCEAVVKKADGKSTTLIFDQDGKFVEEEK